MNTPLRYKLTDKDGNMLARFRHSYDAIHLGHYYTGCKIYNMALGSRGRIVATDKGVHGECLEIQLEDNEKRIYAELKAEMDAWGDQ